TFPFVDLSLKEVTHNKGHSVEQIGSKRLLRARILSSAISCPFQLNRQLYC
ncbi:hypothetical protein X975_19066, partial [Stegodyphus mimosarum]